MNRDYLLSYYRKQYQHYTDRWNETGSERDMREALNYQAEISKLERTVVGVDHLLVEEGNQ